MNICTIIPIDFGGKWLSETIFWISTVLLPNWQWNWMVHSITNRQSCFTTNTELRI